MYQTPNAWVGEVTLAFFNIFGQNKSRQYFKMVDEKNNVTFHISDQFKGFQSLEKKKSSYETENFVKLWKRDSRSIGAAQGRVKRKLREEIKYYEITYACIHGGKKFKPRGKGARQTSLVVLLIINSYTNHAKVKIVSTSSH